MTAQATGLMARLRERMQRKRTTTRLLVNEILSLQLLLTALIGGVAVAGLYWGAQWALQTNHERWATRWTVELNELGAPLYLPDNDEAQLQIERFVHKYAEIENVTYYRADGSFFFSVGNGSSKDADHTSLDAGLAGELGAKAGTTEPYLFAGDNDSTLFQILGPIWTAEISGDGLYSFHPLESGQDTSVSVIGLVGLNLDFSWYGHQLLMNVRIAVVAMLGLLVLSGLISRLLLRHSLKSLSELRGPIEELARGNLSVEFKQATHGEIAAIVETLDTTATALAEKNARLSKLANHDSLTGLINRHRFVMQMDKEIDSIAASGRRSALFFVDLDQFKYVNDTCGYLAGDHLLRQTAKELERCVGKSATVARFGGDEFAVLAWNVTRRQAKSIGNTIVRELRQLSYVEDDIVFHAQCSVGITMINSNRFSTDELVAQADIACREAKARGRNRMEFYRVSGGKAKQSTVDAGWVGMLRDALKTDSFVLRYQPIVHLRTGETTHHEVLLRLRAHDGQLVSPAAFLPAATRFGLMGDIDIWVVEHAIKALSEYREQIPELRLTVNLSAAAFDTKNLATLVRTKLAQHNVAAESLIFEITEQAAVRQLDGVREELVALRELGCEIAIDDFGTGYSSFSYVKHLPADYIKIDGAFVKDVAKDTVDQTMVRVIGEIGRAAGMKTIAEYVRNAAAVTVLAKLGIDYAQGYYIGRPTATPIKRSIPIPIGARPYPRKKNARM